MFCSGQLLPISEYETLFQLIGTTYGGDGQSTFALPDLQSRVPIHQGGGFVLAENAGVESVTLTSSQIPAHTHALRGTTSIANSTGPGGNVLAQSSVAKMYFADVVDTEMAHTIQPVGGNQPHDNLQPYLVVNFIISLFGIFPSQT
jgi:microcystin-dependent protein